jgi:serpin B
VQLSMTLPLSFVVSSLLASGCIADAPPDRAGGSVDPAIDEGVSASSQERIQAPNVPAADLAATVAGNTAFALDLYQELRALPGNLSYSPFSLSEELAMTWAGARGETGAQIAKALHFDLPASRLHPAFHALDRALAHQGDAPGKSGQGLQIRFANALWGQRGAPFAVPFLDTLARDYGATLHVVDFKRAPDSARVTINQWVTERTAGRIPDLLSPGTVTADTRLLLADAVYFHAAWKQPFDPASTRLADFTRLDGSTVSTPTMADTKSLSYGEGEDYAALALPYATAPLTLLLLLPEAGRFEDFEASLTPSRLDAILAGLGRRSVTLSLPRFTIASSFDLGAHLAKLGMPQAFGAAADLSGIDGVGRLAISTVAHEAFVSVDEAGTEAAAATGTAFTTTAAYLPAEIHFDRPFVFLIRDDATGSILFMGRVANPQG